jgi:hypothetical protein
MRLQAAKISVNTGDPIELRVDGNKARRRFPGWTSDAARRS